MSNFQENIVPSEHQNEKSWFKFGDKGFKVLFAGNSITKHAPKPEIGWTNDCGMAASDIDHDYVHLLLGKIKKEYRSDVSFAIAQAAEFERHFTEPDFLDKVYGEAKDYNPDLLIMFFGANVSKDYDIKETKEIKFGDKYEEFRNYLKGENTIVVHSEGFYTRPVLDAEKKAVADKYSDTFIEIKELRERTDTHGKFNHPSDKGMSEIAEKFWQAIKPLLPPIKY